MLSYLKKRYNYWLKFQTDNYQTAHVTECTPASFAANRTWRELKDNGYIKNKEIENKAEKYLNRISLYEFSKF